MKIFSSNLHDSQKLSWRPQGGPDLWTPRPATPLGLTNHAIISEKRQTIRNECTLYIHSINQSINQFIRAMFYERINWLIDWMYNVHSFRIGWRFPHTFKKREHNHTCKQNHMTVRTRHAYRQHSSANADDPAKFLQSCSRKKTSVKKFLDPNRDPDQHPNQTVCC